MDEATFSDLVLASLLGGGTALLSPSNARLLLLTARCLPFSDPIKHPATKEGILLWIPPTSFLRHDGWSSREEGAFQFDFNPDVC